MVNVDNGANHLVVNPSSNNRTRKNAKFVFFFPIDNIVSLASPKKEKKIVGNKFCVAKPLGRHRFIFLFQSEYLGLNY